MEAKAALRAAIFVSSVACSGSSATTFDTPQGDASVATADASSTSPPASNPPSHSHGGPDAAVPDAASGYSGDASLGASKDGSAGGSAADSGSSHGGPGGNSNTCVIAGVTYQAEDDNPANICQWCAPSHSTTAWSNITDGAACGTNEACFGGICTSSFPDCVIDGTAYAPNTASPTNPCALCQPRQSENAWTNAPDGTACPGGSCFAGACD